MRKQFALFSTLFLVMSLSKLSYAQNAERIKALEDNVSILTGELQKLKMELIVPEETPKYQTFFGLGPAASKVYGVSKGISLGGYGQAYYRSYVDDKGTKTNTGDILRFIIYAGYKFSDKIIMNTEFEVEHGTTSANGEGKRGSVSVEFNYLDFLLSDSVNIRAGLMLIPMGFVNEIHEPPFFHGNIRPDIERNLIPSTWRELGIGLFGNITPKLQYKLYVVNGMNAKQFSGRKPVRSGRQKGNRVLMDDVAVTGRLDYTPIQGLLVGTSFWYGNSGHGQDFGGEELDVTTAMYDLHAQYKHRGFEFRALGTLGFIDDTEKLSDSIGETVGSRFYGWYGEVAYNVLPIIFPESEHYLAPFFRYSRYNPHDEVEGTLSSNPEFDTTLITTGLTYKPIPNVVIKVDYKNYQLGRGRQADELNVGFGFIF